MRISINVNENVDVDVPMVEIIEAAIERFNTRVDLDASQARHQVTELLNAALGWTSRLTDEQIAALSPGQRKTVWDFMQAQVPRWSKDHLT